MFIRHLKICLNDVNAYLLNAEFMLNMLNWHTLLITLLYFVLLSAFSKYVCKNSCETVVLQTLLAFMCNVL